MKKKLLILGLIMAMTLTACGGKDKKEDKEPTKVEEASKGLTAEEEKKLEEYIKKNSDATRMYREIDKENRALNIVLKTDYKNSDLKLADRGSKAMSDDIGKKIKVNLVFEDDKESILKSVEDGEVIEDNIEEYLEKHPEKDRRKEDENKKEESKNTYKSKDYTYEFTNFEVVNDAYDTSKKVLAITMKFTNNSSEPESPWMAIAIDMSAKQEGVEELNGGNLPESYKPELAKLYMTDVKPGATVDVVVSYELVNPDKPVKLVDRFTEGSKYSKEIPVK